jgi:L-aspartate oxidase
MWNAAGIERSGPGLRAASEQLANWSVAGDDVHSLETRNLLELARVLTAAALAREESRGAHFRSDFPETEISWQHSQIYAMPLAVRC